MTVQVAARLNDEQMKQFQKIARDNGVTPAQAIRMFVTAFNRSQGFPFPVTTATPTREQIIAEFLGQSRDYHATLSSDYQGNPLLDQMIADAQEAQLV